MTDPECSKSKNKVSSNSNENILYWNVFKVAKYRYRGNRGSLA